MSVRDLEFTEKITLVTEACFQCGVLFAMGSDFHAQRQQDHLTFYCPAGHGQMYTGRTDAEHYRQQLERAKAENVRLKGERDRMANDLMDAAKEKRRLERERKTMEKRIHAGVCPFCRRNFANLRAHMVKRHPESDADRAEAESERQRRVLPDPQTVEEETP